MDDFCSDTESSDGEDWKQTIYEERIDLNWLNYNPHAFFPQDEHFYRTGIVPKIKLDPKIPTQGWTPHFIIGCGRSGTTILSKILSAHPDICFLNEPRSMWMQTFPNVDVWSVQATSREGKLKMPSPSDTSASKTITSLFYTITEMLGKSNLIEKTPENTFRLEWLDTFFPNCKFVMIKRNPIQTARSISRFQPDTWFGYDQYKWKQLLELLERFKGGSMQPGFRLSEEYLEHAENCVFAKALVEWALSTLSAEEFKMKLTQEQRKERFFEVHLESMIRDAHTVLPALLTFLDLKECDKVYQLADQLLRRELTLSSCADTLNERISNGISEVDLLAMAGPELRNLIFQHSYHI